jgi:hypothetical protein
MQVHSRCTILAEENTPGDYRSLPAYVHVLLLVNVTYSFPNVFISSFTFQACLGLVSRGY